MTWTTAEEVGTRTQRLRAALTAAWPRIVLVVAAVTLLAVGGASLVPQRFAGEARILIGDDRAGADDAVARQAEVVSSADLLNRAADQLQLAGRQDLAPVPSLVGRLLVLVGLKGDPAALTAGQQTLAALQQGLDVHQVTGTRQIAVAFTSSDPALAAAVPNALADQYVALQQAARRQANPAAQAGLDERIAQSRRKLADIDGRMAAAKDGTAPQNASPQQRIAELSAQLARMQAARAAVEERASALKAALSGKGSLEENPDLQDSDAVAPLWDRQHELSAQLADLSITLLDNHPRMRTLKAQLAEVNGQIKAEARKVLATIEGDAEAAKGQEARVEAELAKLQSAADDTAARASDLQKLGQERAAAQAELDGHLAERREASTETSRFYLPADARVFARATVPAGPVSPRLLPIGIAASAGSLLVMLIATLLAAARRRPAAVEAREEMPEVEEVAMPPRREPEPEPASWAASESLRVAEAISRLSQPALPEIPARQPSMTPSIAPAPVASPPIVRRTIGEVDVGKAAERLIATGATRAVFVSPEGDEGAAASVLVAREVADAGLRAILLDLTASGAASRPMLEGNAYAGITNLLVSESSFADIIHNDLYSSCQVIPAGTADPVRAMRAAERLPIILDSLTTAYDVVVVECGAIGGEGIRRLVVDDTTLLVAAIQPSIEIADMAAELARQGLGRPIIVSPGEIRPPRPGRSAA